ncbi:MAG: hypothetical protein AB8C02_12785, partial [Halioglobus sp.]
CKLEITVPTSGSVSTTSTVIDCAAGATCTIDIADIFFNETFEADPAAGFVFDGWKTKHRAFCGGSSAPCQLETSGFAGIPALTAILNDPSEVFYLEPSFKSTGFDSLFIGHSFFAPFVNGMPAHTANANIPNHTQSLVFGGGATGTPQALWENTSRRNSIQAVLDTGTVEMFGMTYHPDYPTTEGYENWIDYALSKNPNTRFFIGLPWLTTPASFNATTYGDLWLGFHSGAWHAFIDQLRALYPGIDIACIPYGQTAVELRDLLADNNLPDVTGLTGAAAQSIFTDTLGHPGHILRDTGRLVWLNAIYGVDLATYSHDPGYITDLKAMAQAIMDEHDPSYDGDYH